MDNIKIRIEKLRLLKRHYDLQYWRDPLFGTSQLDEIYDQVRTEFKELLSNNPEYKLSEDDQLESIYMNTFAEVKHKYKLLSLGKAFSVNEYIKWQLPLVNDIKSARNKDLVFEFKIDGLAISLEYEDGILVKASTRGDGEFGDDITPTVYLIPDIPKKLPNNFTGELGGEIHMRKSSLKKLNIKLKLEGKKELKNVRNAAAGIARQKDTSTRMAEYLNFLCYRCINDNYKTETYVEEMTEAKNLGFNTVYHDLISFLVDDIENLTSEKIENMFKKFQDQRENLDLDIDGIVIKINDKFIQNKLGETKSEPNWAIAYKFPAMEKLTTLLGVEWEYGVKDGRFTPMAVIEPVDIGGTTVKRPTLHNIDEIKRLGLKIGCTLRVSRRGDVIPKVEEVIHELTPEDAIEIQFPQVCPICNEKTIIDGAFIKCNNHDCQGRVTGRIKSFVSSVEIDNLGTNTIDKLVDEGKINSIIDLYKLDVNDIATLDKMGEKSAKKILKNIENSKQQVLWKIIAGLCIPMVGSTAGKSLEKNFKSLNELKGVTKEQLMSIKDIGNVVSNNIIEWFNKKENIELIDQLIDLGLGTIIEKIEIKEDKLNGKKIAFTGKLNKWSRTECEKIIEINGGIVWAIKKELDILLIGDGAKPNKIEKARGLGANVMTENEFLELIK